MRACQNAKGPLEFTTRTEPCSGLGNGNSALVLTTAKGFLIGGRAVQMLNNSFDSTIYGQLATINDGHTLGDFKQDAGQCRPDSAESQLRRDLEKFLARCKLSQIILDLEKVVQDSPGTREAEQATKAIQVLKDDTPITSDPPANFIPRREDLDEDDRPSS